MMVLQIRFKGPAAANRLKKNGTLCAETHITAMIDRKIIMYKYALFGKKDSQVYVQEYVIRHTSRKPTLPISYY
jgi:hypothetical protein